MDEGVLYGLMAAASVLDLAGFVGHLRTKSILWALFPFFGALVAWQTYVQLGKDGAIIVAYDVVGGNTVDPITQDPGIMALVLGFLIIISFLIVFLIGVKRKR